MKKALFLFSALFCNAFWLQAESGEALFNQGNAAYKNSDFAQAAQLYHKALAAGYRSAALEYNLGNAFFRQEKLGKAILHFERATLLAPGDADIRHNLATARRKIKDDVTPLPGFFLAEGWKALRRTASSGSWGGVALALWWAGFAGLCVWIFGKNRRQKKTGFLIGAICLSVSVLPFSLSLSQATAERDSRQAIFMQATSPLRSAPDDASAEVLALQEGMKMEVLDQIGGWWKVKLVNGEMGWVREKAVEKI